MLINKYMILDFLEENFFYLHPGYTVFNTIIFGIVLGVIILCIIKIFDKIGKDPLELIYPLIPIIIFGSTSRALVDNNVYPRIHLLATPGIYIFIGLLTIALLLVSIIFEKYLKVKYYKIIFITGLFVCIPNIIIMLNYGVNVEIIVFEMCLWAFISTLFFIFKNKIKILGEKGNLEVLSAHIFDATSTFVAMDFFGYYEQHVLPTFMINSFGTALIMYPLKIIMILVILYVTDEYVKEVSSNHMIKLSVFILGLAPGIRNFATLVLSIS